LDVRVAYDQVRAYLFDPEVRKVVLIGHSQGGIIISMLIDELLKTLPQGTFSKVVRIAFPSILSHVLVKELLAHPKWINGFIVWEENESENVHSHDYFAHPPET